MPISIGRFIRTGKLLNEPAFWLGKCGNNFHITNIIAQAITAITAKVERQSNACPIILPSGKPRIIANELPKANKPNACCFLSLGATRITKEAVIDQNRA